MPVVTEDTPKVKEDAKWYVISTQSGHEHKVADAINQRVKTSKLETRITEVLVPVQKKITPVVLTANPNR